MVRSIVTAGVGHEAGEKRPDLVEDKGTSSDAAGIRALAEQAEAEAAEAEALAAAARARARAIQLRRRAEQVEATAADAALTESSTERADDVHRDADVEDTVVVGEPELAADAGSDTATPEPGWYRRLQRPTATAIAAVTAMLLIIALSVASTWMVLEHRKATEKHRLEAEFIAAARQGVVTLTSLDFNNAKQGVQRIIDDSTGSFKDDFAKMAGDFTKVVEQSKVVEQGSVQAVAVDLDTMTKDSAVALVASTSEVTNAAGAKQDPRNFRLIVTLTRDGGQLKMSKVEFVP